MDDSLSVDRPEAPSYDMAVRSQGSGGLSVRYGKDGAKRGWNGGPDYYRQPGNEKWLDSDTAYFVEYDEHCNPIDICGCNGYDPWREAAALGLNGYGRMGSQEDPDEEATPYEPDEFVPDIMDITRDFCR